MAPEDQKSNPENSYYDNKFKAEAKNLNKSEENPFEEPSMNDNGGLNSEKLNNTEENPKEQKSDWGNNVSGSKKSEKSKLNGKFSFLKKKGPLGFIIAITLGGGIGISTLFSPGILIVQMKEVMVNKFNSQLTSMDIRTNKVLKAKMLGNTSVCGSIIKCKYSSMSDSQIKKLKNAGIEVISDAEGSKTLFGRTKVQSLKFNGKTILPTELDGALAKNVEFRTAVKKGYNPKFAGFADSIWNKAAFTIKITKKPVSLDGETDEAKLKSIQEEVKTGNSAVSANAGTINESDEPVVGKEKPDGSGKYTQDDVDAFNNKLKAAAGVADAINEEADTISKTGVKSITGAASEAADLVATTTGEVTGALTSSLKVTGWIDNLCTAYGTMRAIGFAAKTVRAVQLARYAMLFLNIADQIKAGDSPKPEDVAYLGGLLTADVVSTVVLNGGVKNIVRKAATDSFGYKYAAYGETGVMSDLASQFLAGGGLTGTLIGFTSKLNSMLGGSPQTTCKINNNIFVSMGSAALGIIAAVATGGISITIGAVVSTVLSVGVMFLPALLKDIVAGVVVDKNTVGEPLGDLLTSASSGLMGEVAAETNSPLTVDQAPAYKNLTNTVLSQYAEEDSIAYSPFDISKKNTFMGKIFFNITPYITKMSSLSNVLLSTTSLISKSLSSIIPSTNAIDNNEYTMCQDEDYNSLNLATDPYCNIVYGIPTEALDIDPIEVVNFMVDNNYIDKDTGATTAGSLYETFLAECINREDPIGYTGSDFQKDSGVGCLFNANSNNKYFYLYQIDQRVENGMDGTDSILAAAEESGLSDDISFYDGSNGYKNNDASIAQTSNKETIEIITNPIKTISAISAKIDNNLLSLNNIELSSHIESTNVSTISNQVTALKNSYYYPSFGFIKKQEYGL